MSVRAVPRITDWHHEACRVMTNGDREGRIFLSLHSILVSRVTNVSLGGYLFPANYTNVRIYHECMGVIEKAVPMITGLVSRGSPSDDKW